jgi:hypothetical protein
MICEHQQLERKCEICERDAEITRLRAEVERLNEQIKRDDENDKPYIRTLKDHIQALKNLAPYRLKPGQVVAEWISCPCCAPPEKHCAFCMGVNKILVEVQE